MPRNLKEMNSASVYSTHATLPELRTIFRIIHQTAFGTNLQSKTHNEMLEKAPEEGYWKDYQN
jgi:hypothetical protein